MDPRDLRFAAVRQLPLLDRSPLPPLPPLSRRSGDRHGVRGATPPVARSVMFEDIRPWGMLSFRQEIERAKLDLTSFGHWSGTGLVDYARALARPHGPSDAA